MSKISTRKVDVSSCASELNKDREGVRGNETVGVLRGVQRAIQKGGRNRDIHQGLTGPVLWVCRPQSGPRTVAVAIPSTLERQCFGW